jgi:hypothetical protein
VAPQQQPDTIVPQAAGPKFVKSKKPKVTSSNDEANGVLMSNLLSKQEIENRISHLKDMKRAANNICTEEGSDDEIQIRSGSSKVGYAN